MSTCHFKLVLLGETAVGKSCLVVRFVRDEFFEFQEPTIGAAFLTQTVPLDTSIVKFEIWDTAGQGALRERGEAGRWRCACIIGVAPSRVCVLRALRAVLCPLFGCRTAARVNLFVPSRSRLPSLSPPPPRAPTLSSMRSPPPLPPPPPLSPAPERYRSLAPMYYRGAKAAIVVYDITKTVRWEPLRGYAPALDLSIS